MKVPDGWRLLEGKEVIIPGDRPFSEFLERFLNGVKQFSPNIGRTVDQTDWIAVIRKEP